MKTKDIKKSIRWTIALTLAVNFVFLIKDMMDDVREGAGFWHIGPEILIVVGTVATAVFTMIFWVRAREKADGFERRIVELEVQNHEWQERTKIFVAGLANEIDRQFETWKLSAAEKEIALLVLKGLSNKEIAEIRVTTEQTVKQQSSAVYRKAGLASRAELSAFFLEDLLSPPEPEKRHQSNLQPSGLDMGAFWQ
jgi:DNA-binding CsgD family transcriptional regulator